MKKKFLLGLLTFICTIGLAIGVGVSQANSRWGGVEAESTETFSMDEGASFRLMWTTGKCGITFRGQISTSLLDSGVEPKLLIVPQEYLDAIRSTASLASAKAILDEDGDYIEALDVAKMVYKTVTPCEVKIDESTTYLLGGLKTIQKSNMNKPMFGILFYEQNGERTYASLPYGQEKFVSRSIVYLASGVYATNTSFVQSDAMATEMTDYFMTNGLQEAVNRTLYKQEKQAGTYSGTYTNYVTDYNLSSIVYTGGDKNTTVSASDITSTVYDDYLDNFGLKVQVNDDEFAVGKNLDFYVDVTAYDSNYLTEKSTNGVKYESVASGTAELTVALGKDSSTITATVSPYDITKATITTPTTQINYIEQVQTSGVDLTEKYDSTSYTPTYTLNVPAEGKILTDKTTVLSSSNGTWSYINMPTSGNATGVMANLVGNGNYTGTQNSSTFDVTQNVYTFYINYIYGVDGVDSNNISMAGEVAANTVTVSGVYNTEYSYTSPSVTGHTADTANVSGNITVEPSDVKVTYNVNYYTVSVNCAGQTVTHTVAYASPYKVYTPAIDGYYTDTSCVVGTMGTSNISQTVAYNAVDTTGTATVESIAAPTNLVHYYRDEHDTDTVASDADHYEGNEINQNDYSATYNVVSSASAVGSSTDLTGVVTATNIYYETYVKVTSTSTLYNTATGVYDPYTKLGIQFTSYDAPDYKIMFYINISVYSTTIDGSCKGTGLYKSSKFNGSAPQYVGLGATDTDWVNRADDINFTTEYLKIAASKVGSNFTFYVNDMKIGETKTISELAGDCFFGLMSFCVPYQSTQSSYKLNASSTLSTAGMTGDLDYTQSPIHYWRNDHLAPSSTAAGDCGYEGTEISETECSADYIMMQNSTGTTLDSAVKATNVYFETYVKTVTTTYKMANGELDKYAKLGIEFMLASNTAYKIFFYIVVSNGSTTVSGLETAAGLCKYPEFNADKTTYSYNTIGYRPNSTNFTTNYIKLAVSKIGSSFNFFIDDVKVADTQVIPELAGACYFGVQGFSIGFTTQNSAYRVNDTADTRDTSSMKFATMSEDTFYYEATIKATSRTDATDDYTKIGILLTNPANSWQYFFYMDTSSGRSTHRVGVVDIELQAGFPHYYYWYRARSITVPTINTWNAEHVLSVYKTGNRCVFMIDGMPVLERDDITSFTGAGCQIGVKTFNITATVSNVKYTVNPTTLTQLNKARNILADDISIDGSLSDWTDYEKATYYEARATDGSGRGFKAYAKLGQCGIYVAMEVKSKNCTKQTLSNYASVSSDPDEQGTALRENWWKSFNVEVRVAEEYYSCNCASCADDEANESSMESSRDGTFDSRETPRYASIMGGVQNVRSFNYTSTLGTDGYYTTIIECILPYESINLSRTAQQVKMLFAVRPGVNTDGSDEDVTGLGYWWTGEYNCHSTTFPLAVKDRIYWL